MGVSICMVSGIYYLIINLSRDVVLNIGHLGYFSFTKGTYIYIGSGKGAGGIYRRISRHTSKNKNVFWHIDYLTTSVEAQVLVAIAVINTALNESFLVKLLIEDACFKPTIEGFGCSDLRRDFTHLFKFVCTKDVVSYLISKLINAGTPKENIMLIWN